MATVDIVVPCYGYARFLPACIDSILSQSHRDLRVLVIDDASPDETATIGRGLAERDRRVEFVSHAVNRGHIATYNEGIEWASSEYFLLLSADDLLAPGALERAVAVMRGNPEVGLTYGGCVEFRTGEPVPRQDDAATDAAWRIRPGVDLIAEMCRAVTTPIATATAVARTAAQKKAGPYRAALPHSGDFEMWLRFAALGAVAETRSVQAYRRLHQTSMSSVVYQTVVLDYQQRKDALDLFFGDAGAALPDAASLHRHAGRRLAEQAFWSAVAQCFRGNRRGARELLGFVWRLSPATLMVPPLGHLLRIDRPDRKIASLLAGALQANRRNTVGQ